MFQSILSHFGSLLGSLGFIFRCFFEYLFCYVCWDHFFPKATAKGSRCLDYRGAPGRRTRPSGARSADGGGRWRGGRRKRWRGVGGGLSGSWLSQVCSSFAEIAKNVVKIVKQAGSEAPKGSQILEKWGTSPSKRPAMLRERATGKGREGDKSPS